jgi:Ca2+-binding RTX toxin-like protein
VELLALLLPLGLLAAFGLGGGGDDDDEPTGGETPRDGNDIIAADDQSNTVDGAAGDDLIFGAGGNDQIEGGQTAGGASGNDILVGEGGGDRLIGGNQNDILLGGGGDDVLSGGNDNDALVGGAGDDLMNGGSGRDVILASSGADTLIGGTDNDTLVSIDVNADLSAASAVEPLTDVMGAVLQDRYGAAATAGVLARVQSGVQSADGDTSGDELFGDAGNDTLAGDGRDTMTGGTGIDQFAVFNPTGNDVATILDFDPAVESLVILVPPGEGGVVTFGTTPPGAVLSGAEVRVDGRVVALLQGVAAGAIDPASVTVETL